MANVIVDACAFSEEWVKTYAIPDILKNNNIKIIFSETKKWSSEVGLNINYLRFIKILNEKKRVIKLDKSKISSIEEKISSLPDWYNCSDCDDEHLFAACLSINVGYIITKDIRLCKCRKKMKNNIPKKISRKKIRFSVISNKSTYDNLRCYLLR